MENTRLPDVVRKMEEHLSGELRACNLRTARYGLKLSETSIAALARRRADALMDLPLPPHTAALGEVGLTGEVRSVSRMEPRLNECLRLGYGTVIVPRSAKKPKTEGLVTVPVATVGEAIAYCYKKKPVV